MCPGDARIVDEHALRRLDAELAHKLRPDDERHGLKLCVVDELRGDKDHRLDGGELLPPLGEIQLVDAHLEVVDVRLEGFAQLAAVIHPLSRDLDALGSTAGLPCIQLPNVSLGARKV